MACIYETEFITSIAMMRGISRRSYMGLCRDEFGVVRCIGKLHSTLIGISVFDKHK